MVDMKRVLMCALALGFTAGLAQGLVENGGFENVPPDTAGPAGAGTNQPNLWDSFGSSNPDAWDGVVPMGYTAGHPTANGSEYAYGDADADGSSPLGSIDQIIENIDRPEWEKEIWVGLDMYLADAAGSVMINLSQGGTLWCSGALPGTLFQWVDYDFYIPPDYGFICEDLTLEICIQLGPGAGMGVHGIWIDNVYLDDICIPEPASLALLGLGLPLIRRRRR